MSTPYSLTATVCETRHGAAVEILNAGLSSAGHPKRVGSVEEYVTYEAQVSADLLMTTDVVSDNKQCPKMRLCGIAPHEKGFSFSLYGNVNAIYGFLELMLAKYPDIEMTTVGGDDEGYSTEYGSTVTKRIIETVSKEHEPFASADSGDDEPLDLPF